MFQHILIPTDGSRLSAAAAKAGVRLARSLGARVTGLFAAPPPTPIVYRDVVPVGYGTSAQHEKMIRRAARAHLAVIEKAAKDAKVRCECLSVTSDFPAEAILQTAARRKCDLVFMASHSRRGLRGLLLGSQTQKVLAAKAVTVLVYRGEGGGS